MRDTIKRHQDFHTTDTDPSARSAYFIVRAKKAKFPNDPRVGFMATKRTFKLAVERNRAKRLLRDWVRFCEGLLSSEYDYIFVAYSGILTATREQGRIAMTKALEHIMNKYAKKETK